jgi:hypothetical protein
VIPLWQPRSLLNRYGEKFAAGDRLLDASGNVMLDASGNVMLSDGAGDGCCCGCTCALDTSIVNVRATWSSAGLSGNGINGCPVSCIATTASGLETVVLNRSGTTCTFGLNFGGKLGGYLIFQLGVHLDETAGKWFITTDAFVRSPDPCTATWGSGQPFGYWTKASTDCADPYGTYTADAGYNGGGGATGTITIAAYP